MRKNDISIIVCAYNEEKNIADAIKSVRDAMNKTDSAYEIIVMADGCTDGTVRVARKLAEKDRNIKVIDLGKHYGVGYAVRQGITVSTKEYLSVFPGDNDMDPQSLVDLIKKRNSADLVVGYLGQVKGRGLMRRIASLIYTAFVNKLFNMKIQYFNGPFICRTSITKKQCLISPGFTIFAELKIKLIIAGFSLAEIPFGHKGRIHGKSKAIKFTSILDAIFSTFRIWWDIKTH